MENKSGKWRLGDSREMILQDLDARFLVKCVNGKMVICERQNEIFSFDVVVITSGYNTSRVGE